MLTFNHTDFLIDDYKISKIGNFEIIQQKHQLKLNHPYASTTIKCFHGKLHFTNRYKDFITNNSNNVSIDLDGIESIMKKNHELKAKKEIDKNAANLARNLLMMFIESKLEDIEYSKSCGDLYIEYQIKYINHTLLFSWKNYEELIRQEANELFFKTSMWDRPVKFSEYYSRIERVKQLQVDKINLNKKTTTYNSQWYNFQKDVMDVKN